MAVVTAHGSSSPAVLRLGNGQVLLRGAAVVDVWRLAQAAADQVCRRDGMQLPARIRVVLDALAAESGDVASLSLVAATGHADVRMGGGLSASKQITTRQAAAMLGLSERQVRRSASSYGGRLLGGRWTFDEAEVAAVAAERNAA